LGAAVSTVSNVFGGVELFDNLVGGVGKITDSQTPLVGIGATLLSLEATFAKGGFAGNGPLDLVKNFSGSVSNGEAMDEFLHPAAQHAQEDKQSMREQIKEEKAREQQAEKARRETENEQSNKLENSDSRSGLRLNEKSQMNPEAFQPAAEYQAKAKAPARAIRAMNRFS